MNTEHNIYDRNLLTHNADKESI